MSNALQDNVLHNESFLLRNGKIFITGGTGFFGKWLLELFQTLETNVVVLSRNPNQFVQQFPEIVTNSKITFIQGDVRDFNFPSGHFDYVIHAATEASVKLDRENPDEMYSVIVDGTRRVIEFSKQAAIERLLYVSSGAVYGVQPPDLSHIPETFPCNPVTAYGKGKLKAEQMCIESGIETVIARCFAFIGPWLPLDTHFAIGNFIGNCLRNEPIEIKGDGTPMRSYLYGSDLAKWLLTLLLKGRSGEIYNVGSEDAISIADLAYKVRKVLNSTSDVLVCNTPKPTGNHERYVPSTIKARRELGLTCTVELDNSIFNTMRFHKGMRP